jgi:hypothetical protein
MLKPPYDNMGVNSATSGGYTALTVPAKAALLGPEDYFYRLALDTLQVSVRGHWRREAAAAALLAKRRDAERYRLIGSDKVLVEAPGGRMLEVLPHGGRPSYQLLMRDADSLEVRALPSGKMPSFIFRFGARWCNEHSRSELAEWLLDFTGDLDFKAEKIQLSEVHIRCDSPIPFVQGDVKRMRGTGTRNGRFNTHYEKGRLSGIDNLGGKKQIKFVIYDKRLEQVQKQGLMWPAIWHRYGIDHETPIWRVEGRFCREVLTALGLDHLSDLTDEAIAGIWYRFTSRYLNFVSDAARRTDRTTPARKWAKIQTCGKLFEARPIAAEVDVTALHLFKQAAGCLAKAIAISGTGSVEAEMERLLDHAVIAGMNRFEERHEEYVQQMAETILQRTTEPALPGADGIRDVLRGALRRALADRLPAQPFAPVRAAIGTAPRTPVNLSPAIMTGDTGASSVLPNSNSAIIE